MLRLRAFTHGLGLASVPSGLRALYDLRVLTRVNEMLDLRPLQPEWTQGLRCPAALGLRPGPWSWAEAVEELVLPTPVPAAAVGTSVRQCV